MKKRYFFNDIECKKIEDAIAGVETKTSGELVVMTVKSSDNYSTPILTAAYFISLILSWGLFQIIPKLLTGGFINSMIKRPFNLNDEFTYILNFGVIPFFLLSLFLTLVIFYLLFKFKKYAMIFIPEKIKIKKIEERAFKEFYAGGLNNTRDKTGILFIISEFEKKVFILADEGIYKKIEQETLNSYANEITASIKKGDKSGGVVRTLENISEILEKYFPAKKDNFNELANTVIQTD